MFASEFFDLEFLIIAGDLNFTLCSDECLGKCRKRDPLADLIKMELLNRNLVDIAPTKMMPTWDNSRSGEAYIAKRIDRFIIHASVIDKMGMPFSFIGITFSSDHRPIVLSWREKGFRVGYPFKFNRTWLEIPEFNAIISKSWKELLTGDSSPPMMSLREKMVVLRKVSKEWQQDRRKKDMQLLHDIQMELDHLIGSTYSNDLPLSIICHIRDLKIIKQKFLLQEEASWRLKSRAIWLKEGGYYVSHQDIKNEAVRRFKTQYKRKEVCDFQDVLWGIELAPTMFDDNDNASLFQQIIEGELLGILKAFSKDKILGPDGWTIEFYIHFFDLLKNDLLQMVEASRISRSIHHNTSSTLIALIPKKNEEESFHDFRPISLCNISFKIISMIIAERLKPTLASFLSMDQHFS
eukprot:PITA_14782